MIGCESGETREVQRPVTGHGGGKGWRAAGGGAPGEREVRRQRASSRARCAPLALRERVSFFLSKRQPGRIEAGHARRPPPPCKSLGHQGLASRWDRRADTGRKRAQRETALARYFFFDVARYFFISTRGGGVARDARPGRAAHATSYLRHGYRFILRQRSEGRAGGRQAAVRGRARCTRHHRVAVV